MQSLKKMIEESPWASALDATELAEVTRDCHEQFVPLGGCAVRNGDPADRWFGVIDGLLTMSVSGEDGRHSSFTGVTAGAWAGEGSLLKPGVWRYDALAVKPTRVALMPKYVFERLVATNLGFNRFLLSQLNARLSLFIGLVEHDRLLGPVERVARCLVSLLEKDLNPHPGNVVSLSQEEIGLLSAISRQRANESLHELESAGLLRIEFGAVTVLDLHGLRTYRASVPRAARPKSAHRRGNESARASGGS